MEGVSGVREAAHEIRGAGRRLVSMFNPERRTTERYCDAAEKIDFATKHNDCGWSGKPGDSRAIPREDTEAGRSAIEKLAEFDQTSVRFNRGEPDFAKCTVAKAEIEVTGDHSVDKYRACVAIAKQWDVDNPKSDGTKWTAQEVRAWAKENNLELHHDSDMKTMRFVPAEIHRYFKHMGGCAEIKARDEVRNGSVFDD